MDYEKKYINYLIENKKSIDTKLLDKYFQDEIDFKEVIETVDLNDIQSYDVFIKDKKINQILKK